jgi:hypothetical protein
MRAFDTLMVDPIEQASVPLGAIAKKNERSPCKLHGNRLASEFV